MMGGDTGDDGLAGRICVITGGGSGIGRATALRLARDGARVVLVGRTAAKLEAVRREVEALGGSVTVHALDIADLAAVQSMVQDVLARFQRIDVLVNNAGDGTLHRRLLTTTPQELRAMLDANLCGTIYCTQAVVPAMLAARQGTIINLASIAGAQPGVHSGMAYSAAKAAVINFTQFLEAEFRNRGLRVCVILPGEVDTPLLDKRPQPPDGGARSTMVAAEDVADVIACVVRLPQRATVREVVIRPTIQRDVRAELEKE
ncbi:MAG TPA: SDR family oxidoreductase [Thermoanaerobaculia bacterium]|nr:SDR family oxidoreductase [Thermoanaerobaculia bacterium]